METKVCNKCGVEKKISLFVKRNKTEFRNECKNCASIHGKEYRKNNRQKIAERKKKYYLNNVEIIKKATKYYSKNNRTKINERQIKYYKNNERESERNRKRSEINRKKLLPTYIRGLLKAQNINAVPEIIELKRLHITGLRLIKKLQQNEK